MLRTKARLDALAAEIDTLRDADARLEATARSTLDDAVAAISADAKAGFDASREALRSALDEVQALRQAMDEEKGRSRELREEIARLCETIDRERKDRERSSNSVAKLERRLQQHADDLRTATVTLLARTDEIAVADPSDTASRAGGAEGSPAAAQPQASRPTQ